MGGGLSLMTSALRALQVGLTLTRSEKKFKSLRYRVHCGSGENCDPEDSGFLLHTILDQEEVGQDTNHGDGASDAQSKNKRLSDVRNVSGESGSDDTADVATEVLDSRGCAYDVLRAHRLGESPGVGRGESQPAKRRGQQPDRRHLVFDHSCRDDQTCDGHANSDESFSNGGFTPALADQPVTS